MNTNPTITNIDTSRFKEGIDLRLMYQDMFIASEGYMWRMQQMDKLDIDKVVKDYREIIDFWKSLYLK